MNIAFWKTVSSFASATAIGGAVLVGCGGSSGSQEEDPPATTSEELRAGCHWKRSPGPCPVAQPGGGTGNLCWPALYGNAHWERVCACPPGEVQTGTGCSAVL
jgi:hypothetical protein